MQRKFRSCLKLAFLSVFWLAIFPAWADDALNNELIKSVVAGHNAQVKDLLNRGASPNSRQRLTGWTAVSAAAFYGYPDVVLELVHAGADVNARDVRRNTPLMRAVTIGPYEDLNELLSRKVRVTKILLEAGANPYVTNMYGEAIWRMPSIDHHEPLAEVFENAGINDNQEVEMMEAIARDDMVAVRSYLDGGVDLNYHDAYGWTFLKQAQASNNSRVRDLLISASRKNSPPQK